jgi:(p)ppGpp synthase/HD superfamily hydrolase
MSETHLKNEPELDPADPNQPNRFFSRRFDDALRYAADAHRFQKRKSAPSVGDRPAALRIPYIGHLIGVASIVIDAGGSEDEAIAAVLHDAPEDQGGQPRLDDIRAVFGDRVAEIVLGCTDSLATDPEQKAPWRHRKERYIAHLRASDERSVYLVSAADKCHNARATARDLAFANDPQEVWSKFKPGRDGTLWFYRSLVDAFLAGPPDDRRDLIVSDLQRALKEMEASR